MADILLAVQKIVRTGLSVVRTASGSSPLLNTSDNFQFINTGKESVHLVKTGAGACNAIFKTPGKVDGLDIAERTVVVAATTGDVEVGPFDPAIYNTPGTNLLAGFTVSEVTGLSAAVKQLK